MIDSMMLITDGDYLIVITDGWLPVFLMVLFHDGFIPMMILVWFP